MRIAVLLAASIAVLSACRSSSHQSTRTRIADAAMPADMIFPVYALRDGPNDPLADRLCRALHRVPAQRRAACCNGQAATNRAADCARVLSAALRGKAIRLDAAEIDRCAAAISAAYDGCTWVGFAPLPLPDDCRGVAHGLLLARTGCRSALECEGLLHCEGLAPASPGVCRAPKGHGASCAPGDDALASLLGEDRLDETHPECAGHCERGRCATPITPGGPCADSLHCGPGFHCVKQRCVAGWRPKVGEPCALPCEGAARCVKGACAAAAKEGTTCGLDDECAGRCVHDGEKGHCGPACGR